MAGEWNEMLPHVLNTILSGSLGVGGRWLYERWKRVRLVASDWQLLYAYRDAEGGVVYDASPADKPITHVQYQFTIRLFNEKSSAIGLHRFAVLFTKGWGWARKSLFRDDNVCHPSLRKGIMFSVPLADLTVPPNQWVVQDIRGHADASDPGVAAMWNADAVWLQARGADGRKYKWHIAGLTPVR